MLPLFMDSMLLGKLRKELEQELKKNILPYWMTHAPDRVHGGFVGYISHRNHVDNRANKGIVLHARILWTFSAAYRKYGEDAFLEMADRAYCYIMDHFIDREHGGVFWELDYMGTPVSTRKQVYAIAFAIYAMTEYWQASGEGEALDTAIRLFGETEAHALDSKRNGYIEALSGEWEPLADVRLSEKDANEPKTMNTHLHIMEAYTSLFGAWKDPRLQRALENIIRLFIEKFIDPGTWHLNLFFDDDWRLKSSFISFGHDIECSWLLHEAAWVLGKRELAEQTGQIAVRMARANFAGLDKENGLIYEMFPGERRMDTDRHWWPQAEALVGYFNAYQLSGEEEFFHKAAAIWDFIRKRIIDREHGEWFWGVDSSGVPDTGREKAGFWKCPYHNSRACLEMMRRIDETLARERPRGPSREPDMK
jgi:mannobiose 2-epimerase